MVGIWMLVGCEPALSPSPSNSASNSDSDFMNQITTIQARPNETMDTSIHDSQHFDFSLFDQNRSLPQDPFLTPIAQWFFSKNSPDVLRSTGGERSRHLSHLRLHAH